MAIKPTSTQVVDLLAISNLSEVHISGTAVFYSESFALPDGDPDFAFEYKAESDGNVKLKLELEQGNTLPETEGSSDGNMVVPDGAAEFDNALEDELTHIKAYTPAATSYARAKVTGLETNDSSTVLKKLKMTYIK